jgi:hypothetical protein
VIDTRTYPVRLTRRIQGHLEGTQAYADIRAGRVPDNNPILYSLFTKWLDATNRKDGSCTIRVTKAEADLLRGYVAAQEAGAADNVGWEPSALGELNACRALLPQLTKITQEA